MALLGQHGIATGGTEGIPDTLNALADCLSGKGRAPIIYAGASMDSPARLHSVTRFREANSESFKSEDDAIKVLSHHRALCDESVFYCFPGIGEDAAGELRRLSAGIEHIGASCDLATVNVMPADWVPDDSSVAYLPAPHGRLALNGLTREEMVSSLTAHNNGSGLSIAWRRRDGEFFIPVLRYQRVHSKPPAFKLKPDKCDCPNSSQTADVMNAIRAALMREVDWRADKCENAEEIKSFISGHLDGADAQDLHIHYLPEIAGSKITGVRFYVKSKSWRARSLLASVSDLASDIKISCCNRGSVRFSLAPTDFVEVAADVWVSTTPVMMYKGHPLLRRCKRLLDGGYPANRDAMPDTLQVDLTFVEGRIRAEIEIAMGWTGDSPIDKVFFLRQQHYASRVERINGPACYAAVRFKAPVSVPVVAGHGRFFGVGVFAPARTSTQHGG